MKKIFGHKAIKRGFAKFIVLTMCISLLNTTAFAAELNESDAGITIDTNAAKEQSVVENEDGSTTVVEITEDVWNDETGSGEIKAETSVTTNPEGDVIEETESVEGTETKTETLEPVESEEHVSGNTSTEITLKPGESKGETIGSEDIVEAIKPDTSTEEWTENEDGSHTKTENIEDSKVVTTVKDTVDEAGNTVITTETVTTTTTESSIEVDVPEEGTTENEDGSITTIKVTTDENGKVTGYTEVTEVVNEEGVVVSSTTKTVSRSGSSKTTTVTTTVKTQTVAPDAKTDINVSMGEITEGKNHGKLDLNGIEVVDVPDNFNDLLEPGESDSNINLDDIPDDSMVFVDGIGLMSKYNITIMIAKNPSFIGQTKYTVGWPVQQYIVKDKDGNSHVVYCADMSVPAEDGNEYYLENAEDADYYTNPNTNKKDPDGSWHIRDIATNGYWGTAAGEMGSLSVMIDNLLAAKEAGNEFLQNVTEEDIKALTEGQALAATQAAIWKYGNSMNNNPFVLKGGDLMEAATENSKLEYDPVTGIITRTTTTVDKETGKIITKTEHKEVHLPTGVDVEIERDPVTGEITTIHVPQYSSAYIKLLPDGWLNNPIHSLVGGKDHHKDDPDVQMIEAVYKWLTNMEKQEDTTTDLIKPSDIVEAVTNVKEQVGKDDQGRDVYEADVSFVLTVEPNRLNGDLMVNVYDSETGEIIATRRIAGDGSNDDPSIKQAGSIHNDKGIVYTIDGLQLANGQQIRINLVGSQEVKKGAYLITAKTGADTSQTFIGIEEGSRDVNLDFTLKLDVNPGVVNTVENSEVVENTEWTEESKVEYSYWEIELPENPTPGPEPDPETPTTPTTSDPDPDPDPEIPEEPEVEIPEEPTPMVETPEEFEEEPEDDIEIFDEDVPLSDIPEIDIPENDIPLSDVPQTGDTFNMMLWVSLMLIAAFGMCIIFVTGKGKKGNF